MSSADRIFCRLRARAVAALAAASLAVMAWGAGPASAQQDQLVANHLTTAAGIGEYEWALAIDRILARESEWLRKRAQPTQGYIFNLRSAIEAGDRRSQLIFNIDPVSPWLAENKQPPFEQGMGDLEIMGLMNCTWPVWNLMTADPEIETLQDLKGRKVALGAKAATATLMMEETLKAAGVFDEIELQYLSFADIIAGMLDGTIDVGLVNLWYNAADNRVGPTPGLINLEASGRGFHFVEMDMATLEKTRDERGVPYLILTIPAGSAPLQTDELVTYANPDYVGVSSDFPEEAAYEYVKQVIDHLDAIVASGGLGALFTPAFLPYGIENLHPGAERAYREAGLIE